MAELGSLARQDVRIVETPGFHEALLACALPEGAALAHGGPRGARRAKEARPYVSSAEVDALLDGASNPLTVADIGYEVPADLAAYRRRALGELTGFDGAKVGLRTDLTPRVLAEGQPVRVQPTTYFRGLQTNEMACETFEAAPKGGTPRPLLAVSDLVIRGGRLLGLEESDLSNHLGASTVVLTADHQIALQVQGAQRISGGETAAGASGAVDLADIDAAKGAARGAAGGAAGGAGCTLQALLRHAMEREAAEELSARFAAPRVATILTGHARYLARGGKPEFFGLSRSTSALSELRPSDADRGYVDRIWGRPFEPSRAGLAAALEALLQEGASGGRRDSLSMVVSLRMALAFLARRGPEAEARLGRLGLRP